MRALLVVSRYPVLLAPFGFLSMAFFRVAMWFNRKVVFFKLMGCGKNGTFDIRPDLQQWAIMVFWKTESQSADVRSPEDLTENLLGTFVSGWLKIFKAANRVFLLEPVAGRGTWDGRSFAGPVPADPIKGPVAILTRATIRLSRLKAFWSAVPGTAEGLESNPGFLYSVGIGEVPFIKQATFSIWRSAEDMEAFAYHKQAHREVIRRTHQEGWYAEEMFLRFRVLQETSIS